MNSFNLLADSNQFINANWPAAENVRALVTTRKSGASNGVYDSFNLAQHVGDNVANVKSNRALLSSRLKSRLNENIRLFWLNQIHSNKCILWQEQNAVNDADASFTRSRNQSCIVMTADCLPILFSNKQGNWVSACHAGWRGLANGVIQNTVKQYYGDSSDLVAWIGPAISQKHFEVGAEVRDHFVRLDSQYDTFFQINEGALYQFDFIGLAKMMLCRFNIECYGGDLCSYSEKEKFYSYRRDGETGRMASLIWFE